MPRSAPSWMLMAAPALTVALSAVPIAAGLAATLLPAFGYLPALGGHEANLRPWRTLLDHPGIATTVALTVATGCAATGLSLAIVIAFCATGHGRRGFALLQSWLAPVLATPHAAMAIGLAFVLAPSGWIARLLSPWLTGWERPPDVATVHDSLGLAMIAGLTVKETPFLLLMTLAALGQVRARETLLVAQAIGHAPAGGWLKSILPQVYPQIRLPVYAVLAYSMSVVDVALILGPTQPSTLSPLVVRWFADRELQMYFPAAAGALLQLAVVVASILAWVLAEKLVACLGRRWIRRGHRGVDSAWLPWAGASGALLCSSAGLLALASLWLWAFADRWRYPDALPSAWTARNWLHAAPALENPLATTLIVGLVATALAAALALACLENEQRNGVHPGRGSLWVLYAPLLIPQASFLFGVHIALVRLRLDGSWLALIWAHLLFVLPYVFLSLADPWRALDPRLARTAACLGAPPWRVFLRIKLPVLARPLLAALAVGFAVSIGQYLATVFAGAGRLVTLTTEAVTLSAGGDRRVLAVYALLQSLLPLIAYAAAVGVPAWRARERRALAVGG